MIEINGSMEEKMKSGGVHDQKKEEGMKNYVEMRKNNEKKWLKRQKYTIGCENERE